MLGFYPSARLKKESFAPAQGARMCASHETRMDKRQGGLFLLLIR